jgi:hypothetical protein
MAVFEKLGKLVAGFWLGLLGIAILLSFPVCGFIASLAIGAGVASLLEVGTLRIVAFFGCAFFFGLFLSVFVWPHARGVVLRCSEFITENIPK